MAESSGVTSPPSRRRRNKVDVDLSEAATRTTLRCPKPPHPSSTGMTSLQSACGFFLLDIPLHRMTSRWSALVLPSTRRERRRVRGRDSGRTHAKSARPRPACAHSHSRVQHSNRIYPNHRPHGIKPYRPRRIRRSKASQTGKKCWSNSSSRDLFGSFLDLAKNEHPRLNPAPKARI